MVTPPVHGLSTRPAAEQAIAAGGDEDIAATRAAAVATLSTNFMTLA